MSYALVGRITEILPHPNAERMEIIRFDTGLGSLYDPSLPDLQNLVTGKHYAVGDLGVWLRPGASIPGWLAHDLWLVGKEKASAGGYRFTVREIPLRGVPSPGLWIGSFYQSDTSAQSHDHARELQEHGGVETWREGQSWITPAYWNDQWRLGDAVDAELGIQPAEVKA
jgi:hypothetical protein